MPKRTRNNLAAFTLVELMVVMVVIVIVAGIALPTIATLVTAGAQEQAYNLLAAQLASARAVAMLEATYAGVHVQPADRDRVNAGDLPEDTMYLAVVIYDRDERHFDVADGFDPKPLPGKTAFGEISGDFVSGGDYLNTFGNQDEIDDFTTFTIVFSPDGSVVLNVEGRVVRFNRSENGFFRGPQRLWNGELADEDGEGVRAVCLFDYTQFIILPDGNARRGYLNEAGRFLPVNIHTGQVFPRQ